MGLQVQTIPPTRLFPMGKRLALPYDAEVEYLESTGTQRIDTGVVPTRLDVLTLTATIRSSQLTSSWILSSTVGAYDENPNHWLYIKPHDTANRFQFWTFSQFQNTTELSNVTDKKTTIVVNLKDRYVDIKNSILDNRFVLNVGYPANNQPPIKIFGTHPVAIHGFMIERDGTIVRDFIPVRVGSVGYLYDRVTRRLFGNAGTGAFILGPDVT